MAMKTALGLAVTASGEVISFHAGQLVSFGPDGEVRRTMPVGLSEGHGLTLVEENGREWLWVADPGFAIACGTGTGVGKLPPTFGTGLDLTVAPGRVVKVSLDGAIDSELPIPPERVHLLLDSKANWVEVEAHDNDKCFAGYPEESIAEWHQRLGLETDDDERR